VNSPGRTVDATIHTVDLFETVLDLANTSSEDVAPANTVIDSVSVKAYLTDSNQDNYHSFAFADTFRTPVNRNDGITISDGTYKLIRFYSDGNEELYFLTNDPEETTNLNDGNMTNAELTAFNYLNSTLDALISGETIDRGENEPTTPIVNEDRTVILRKANATNFAIDGGRGGANGQNVYLWGYGPSNVNIRFVEVDRGDGYYSYVKQDTAHALDGGRGGARAQNVYLWQTSTNNFNQHWRKVSKGGDTYQLQKRNSLGFSIDGGRAGAHTQNVYLWSTGNNNLNQHWIVEYQ